MRDLGRLLSIHLGCVHKTTEVRVVREGENVTITFRHAGERHRVSEWAIDIPLSQHGSSLFHKAARQIINKDEMEAHQRNPVFITDEEYAGILEV